MLEQYKLKRTFDNRLYDFDCSKLVNPGETVFNIVSVESSDTVFTYGMPLVSTAPITYSGGRVAPPGTVIQVQIGGGVIGANDTMGLGYPNLLCTVRAQFTTNRSPNQFEATVQILLKDQISPGAY